ncbi:hypothetical protein ACJX0J_010242, partial [Zea mays]
MYDVILHYIITLIYMLTHSNFYLYQLSEKQGRFTRFPNYSKEKKLFSAPFVYAPHD